MSYTVVELNIYPIKSCKRITLTEATADARGFQFDRRYMVTKPDYNFITQRQYPALALVQPKLDVQSGEMQVSFPDEAEVLTVPLAVSSQKKVESVVWGVKCDAHDMGDEAAEWFSRVLGVSVRLVRMADGFVRPVVPSGEPFAPSHDGQLGFADESSFLLANTASLEDLNTHLASPVPMTRFRPNIVITGASPFEEETWSKIQIGGLTFESVTYCARCKITTVDQDTGKFVGDDPLQTLRKIRYSPKKDGALFGVLLISGGQGTVSVGDKVKVLDTVEAPVLSGQGAEAPATAPTTAPTTQAKHCKTTSLTFCSVLATGLVLNLVLYLVWRSQHTKL